MEGICFQIATLGFELSFSILHVGIVMTDGKKNLCPINLKSTVGKNFEQRGTSVDLLLKDNSRVRSILRTSATFAKWNLLSKMTWTLNGEWKTLNKLGTGGFGKVYRAQNLHNPARFAAVKMEKVRPGFTPFLDIENDFYTKVADRSGFPVVFFHGNTSCGAYRVLVMNLLGSSLWKLTSKGTLSTKTVLMIGIQVLRRLETIHNLGFIHRDIKPDNMLIGYTDPDRIYITDFGIAKRFKTTLNMHIPNGSGYGIAGTMRYASINALKGNATSRRDDLESLGYTLVELLTGSLPWAGAGANYLQIKESTTVSSLCEECPSSFDDYFKYVRELRFEERPNYDHLIDLFKGSLFRRDQEDDRKFDWLKPTSHRKEGCSKHRCSKHRK